MVKLIKQFRNFHFYHPKQNNIIITHFRSTKVFSIFNSINFIKISRLLNIESELELPLKRYYKTNNLLQKYSKILFNFNIYFMRCGSITLVKKRFYFIEVLKCFNSRQICCIYCLRVIQLCQKSVIFYTFWSFKQVFTQFRKVV